VQNLRANFAITREVLRNEIYPWKKRTSGQFYKRHGDIQFANNAAAGIADKPGRQMHGFPCLPSILFLIFKIFFIIIINPQDCLF
jgi:hypothetical protein